MSNFDNYITAKEVKQGLDKILKVAKRLLSDSELCLVNGRHATSVSLSILTLEEVAKAEFFRRKIQDQKGITKGEWATLTKRGSHDFKLNYALKNKEQRYSQWSTTDLGALTEARDRLGLKVSIYSDKSIIEQEINMGKIIIKNFNRIKQECFYADWNVNQRKWYYFDVRFKDQMQNIISNYLFFEAKKQYLTTKLGLILPSKQFKDYSEEDWQIGKNSEISKELNATIEIMDKKMRPNFSLLYQLLSNFDEPSTESNP